VLPFALKGYFYRPKSWRSQEEKPNLMPGMSSAEVKVMLHREEYVGWRAKADERVLHPPMESNIIPES
jgi:hypothetical protein